MNPNRPTILVVDDEPKNIQLLGNLLREAGYSIEYAISGTMAIQWLQTRPFDLVLLDILMPGIDGYEVCRMIKNQPEWRDIPVIFLTARAETSSVLEGFHLGAADYITKPFQKEELLARVGAHITLSLQRTELMNFAHMLQEKAAQLEIENTAKEKLFSVLAHDLRNPLIGIIDFGRLLEDPQQIPPSVMQSLTLEFRTTAERLLALVDNLLAWSRAQQGLISPLPQQVRLLPAVQGRTSIMAVTALQKNVTFQINIDSDLEAWVDREMLGTIIDNLLSNAVKFTYRDGHVTIRAVSETYLVRIEISDDGIGIPPDQMTTLFMPGPHRNRQGTAGERGTGLGLVICKEFVEGNQGKIWVESEEGRGSRFIFTLPAFPQKSTL